MSGLVTLLEAGPHLDVEVELAAALEDTYPAGAAVAVDVEHLAAVIDAHPFHVGRTLRRWDRRGLIRFDPVGRTVTLPTARNRRVQQKRTKGWRKPPGSIFVGRPSDWGNDYVWNPENVKDGQVLVADRAEAIARYAADLHAHPDLAKHLAPLRGLDLRCWCRLDEACHADVLLAAMADD